MSDEVDQEAFGPNQWLVDEMYRRYLENPHEVGESWREFFEGYAPAGEASSTPTAEAPAPGGTVAETAAPTPAPLEVPVEVPVPAPVPVPIEAPTEVVAAPEAQDPDASPLKGVAAVIAANMESSLAVPTATSVRVIPAKLLEENRRIINRYIAPRRGGKVSFTHLIGFAIAKALEARPAMKAAFAEIDGRPHLVEHKNVNLGLAVDIERGGSRVLMVPNIKGATQLDFSTFFAGYEEVIRKVRSNDLSPDDFADTHVTLTNPGTVGTTQSVPRLMSGQGLIVGVGAISYPPEYEAADPKMLARIGVSKVLTVTSTYDHRVIQGAESGQFLACIHDLLLGGERFYDEIFASMRIPYEPVRWSQDLAPLDDVDAYLQKQSKVIQLINQYRVRGHLLAELDPIGWEILSHPELDLSYYGLTVWDLDRDFVTHGLPGPGKQTLRQIIDTLRDAYCRTVGLEYMHIADPEQKRWIQERIESPLADLPIEDKKHILDRLNATEAFEKFLHSKYSGHRRFSPEGVESLIPMLDGLFENAADAGMLEIVMGMSHRGRLNVLANIVGKSFEEIFKEFEGDVAADTVQGSGDVKYHLGMTGRFRSRAGNELAVVLASNASHLESVDPVVEGMAAAKQDVLGDQGRDLVLPVLLHGDAAFAGQGVVAETFNMSALRGYRTGGTVHIVVNNMIGFTTSAKSARSSTYATDVAKMIQAPIVHVNGDDPETCLKVIRHAFAYRQAFHRDVVIDLVCYRRYGHQEVDDPSFTQPLMYQRIEKRRSIRKLYTEQLVNRAELTIEEAEKSLDDFRARLQEALDQTKEAQSEEVGRSVPPIPSKVLPTVETGAPRERLDVIHNKLTTFPEGFEPHPKLRRTIERRSDALATGNIDWAHGEALAFGSLLLEGTAVRLSGQDSRRGTFSQRHAVLIDSRTEEEYLPLDDLGPDQAPFLAYDSLLSEFAVLGFEYGYSVANGDTLVCWEAQFGDFANGAQVIIDQYIVAGEDKWNQQSGLVLLLPHGYEGQGPEHSSARLERFLILAAKGSIQVAQPTTPAQYFHLLRRQMHRTVRKPLIVMTPKSLLRAPEARSHVDELTSGHFRETLDDPKVEDPASVERILLCSGKVAYTLQAERDKRAARAAIVRVEQLYPFPLEQLHEIFDRYPNATELRWVQEEPENMGAWFFMFTRLDGRMPERFTLSKAVRPTTASPATGSTLVHQEELEDLFEAAFS